MLKAKCTVQSCPDAPEGAYKIDKLEVKAGKYTGKGYQFDKPTEDYFKRVQVFDRITARPGSVLLRDKKNPDIAIFGNVEQIKNADFSWKPTIIEAYTKISATNSSLFLSRVRPRPAASACTRSSTSSRLSWGASTRRCTSCPPLLRPQRMFTS